MRKLSQETAVARMSAVFPQYDYSLFTYSGTTKPGVIICPKHGEFKNTYAKLVSKHGCQQCGFEARGKHSKLSHEDAIANMRNAMPQYNYDKFTYTGSSGKSTVICEKHGEFEISYASIVGKHGCHKCKADRTIETHTIPIDEIRRRLADKHPTLNFSKFTHNGQYKKGDVICNKHGVFSITYSDLMQGKGCRLCGIESRTQKRTLSQAEAVLRMRTAMPQYSYDKFKYVNSAHKSTLVCATHGEFEQSYNAICAGIGCARCSYDALSVAHTTPFVEFVSRANQTHDCRYTYNESTYSGISGTVVATCALHGEFKLSCGEHIHNGQGCPSCKDKLFNPSKPGYLYVCLINNSEDNSYAIGYGITKNVNRRMAEHTNRLSYNGYQITLLDKFRFTVGYYCREAENAIKTNTPLNTNVNVRGFRKEATYIDNYNDVIAIAKEHHAQHGKTRSLISQ